MMEESFPENRMISADALGQEDTLDQAIRPKYLKDYTGQAIVCEQMEIFISAAKQSKYPLQVRYHPKYDHSYYFISTFINEHLQFHAKYLSWIKQLHDNFKIFYIADNTITNKYSKKISENIKEILLDEIQYYKSSYHKCGIGKMKHRKWGAKSIDGRPFSSFDRLNPFFSYCSKGISKS